MDEFYDKSMTIPLISDHGIPKTKPDTRKPYQKTLALCIILVSVMFERIAFYSIASDISFTLQSNQTNQTFNWTTQHASIASYIFSGKNNNNDLIIDNRCFFLLNNRNELSIDINICNYK